MYKSVLIFQLGRGRKKGKVVVKIRQRSPISKHVFKGSSRRQHTRKMLVSKTQGTSETGQEHRGVVYIYTGRAIRYRCRTLAWDS